MQSATERARLYLDGVGSPIVTRVRQRAPGRVTVDQALPFLRIHTRVRDQEARSGHIDRVAVAMDGDTPRLVVDLVYDDGVSDVVATRHRRADDTIPDLVVDSAAVGGHGGRREPTLPFEHEGARRGEGMVVTACEADGTPSRDDGRDDEPTLVFRTPCPQPYEPSAPASPSAPSPMRPGWRQWLWRLQQAIRQWLRALVPPHGAATHPRLPARRPPRAAGTTGH